MGRYCRTWRTQTGSNTWSGVLRGYVDFRATSRDEEEEFRYRAPLLDWWLLLTEGLGKAVSSWKRTRRHCPK